MAEPHRVGAPEVTTIMLPDGLDWNTVKTAVEIIEEWELAGDGSATDLVIKLYECFQSK